MRWIRWIVPLLVVGLLVALAGQAYANGGPHGGYTATTDACAGCHRAHTAQGPNLLTATSTYNLCMSCHGSAGTGADTNVEDGVYTNRAGGGEGTVNAALLGGGFTNYNATAVTSIHDADGSTSAAWGFGVARGSTANLPGVLTCGSCHDPHGSNNYRIIRENIAGEAVTVDQVDEANKDYTTENWPDNVSNACVACHGAYHVTRANSGEDNSDDGAGNTDYGGDISTYAHRVGMSYQYGGNADPESTGYGGYTLPLTASKNVACQTCHLPHGTSASMTTQATAPYTNDSALLRLDNRGVCEVCHQK